MWSTSSVVTMTEEVSFRLASRLGFARHRHVVTRLRALGCAYLADYTCVPLSQ